MTMPGGWYRRIINVARVCGGEVAVSRCLSFWSMAVACTLLIGWQPLAAAEDDPRAATEDAENTSQEDAQNAATHYLRAAELLPYVSWEERGQIRDALEKLDPAACSDLLDKYGEAFDKAFELVALGTQCTECDWKTDYSEGPNALLPHITSLGPIVPFGFTRALEHAQKERWNRAFDAWTCSMTLARHISFDPCLVCVMISIRDERTGIAVANKLLASVENGLQRTRLREAWETLPRRPSVHSVAIKERDRLMAWAKSHPGELLQHVGSSFVTAGGLAGYHVSLEPPTFFEKFQGAVLVQSTDWQEIERLVSVNVEITKLPADEIEEASRDLVAQIRSLPKGSTRKIADHLIWAVGDAREKECELEELAESLTNALRARPN